MASTFGFNGRPLRCLGEVDMTLALFSEPRDFVQLSRTCRALYQRWHGGSYVWKQYLGRCGDHAPPCPAGRTHRAWVIVHLTRLCMMCGADTRNPVIGDPEIRLCSKCEYNELVIAPYQPLEYLSNTFWQDGPRQYRQVVLWDDLKCRTELLSSSAAFLNKFPHTGFIRQGHQLVAQTYPRMWSATCLVSLDGHATANNGLALDAHDTTMSISEPITRGLHIDRAKIDRDHGFPPDLTDDDD